MAIGLKIKHSTGEITTGTGNLTLNAAGDLVLDYATFPASDGTAGYILSTDGAGALSWIADSGGPANTDALPEGSSNLYYTDARTDARIVNAGSANWNTAYGWGNHASGGYLTSETSHADVLQDGDFTSQGIMLRGAGAGTYSILADASTNWNTAYTHAVSAHAPSGAEANEYSFKTILVSGQSDVVADTTTDALTLVAGGNMTLTTSGDTITFAAAGGGVSDFVSLTDTPANYSGSASDFVKVNSSGNALIFVADPGYITSTGVLSSHTDVHNAAPTDGQVLTWVNANSRWEPAAGGGGGSQDVFKTIAVSGQSDVVADATTDTLTLVAGSNVTLTTDAAADSVTIAASGGGGGSSSFTFTVNYAAGGTSIASISNLPSGWSSSVNGDNVTITHTASGQPMGISFYGLDKSASPDIWKYQYPTSTYPVTFPDSSEVISATEFTLNIGTAATGANTGTPFATSLAHIKVLF